MKKYRILYTEDDATIAFLTKDNLESQYDVIHFDNGVDAFTAFQNQHFDICIMDIMMPQMDGFELATAIRKINQEVPIIFISAKTMKEDRIKGLKIGADDYLIKPFSIEELILKIEIFLKRSQKNHQNNADVFFIGKCIFDANNYTINCDGELQTLTQRESELLHYFVMHKNKVLKREEILLAIWGSDDYFLGRSLDVFISRLRKIFAKDTSVQFENIHSIGFKFKTEL